MKCPYRIKTTTIAIRDMDTGDDNIHLEQHTCRWDDCDQENCGVWKNDQCGYNT